MSHSPAEMHSPKEPLQRLPQQPLISSTGARLVLRNDNAGYPDHTDPGSPGRGRWFNNIANTDTKTFLQAGNSFDDPYLEWAWPAVVLTPEEYKLRVGGMSSPSYGANSRNTGVGVVFQVQQQMMTIRTRGYLLGHQKPLMTRMSFYGTPLDLLMRENPLD